MAKYCPECSELLGGQEKCKKCGRSEKKQQQEKNKQKSTDHRCNFSNGSIRCPLTGTRNPNMFGKGHWLCSFHNKYSDDPAMSAHVLDDIVQNKLYESEKDWHDEMVDKKMMNLGVMDETAKRDTLQYMRDVIKGLTNKGAAA